MPRRFLDRVCDHTLAFDAAGGADFFEGSISDYDACKANDASLLARLRAAGFRLDWGEDGSDGW